ncbi:MAG TPA: phosphatidylserine decarboxylase [Elusimicrobiota bacterium]|nr:phosphatidylserine decarboxylase [Elusimicrobiota bacterium]
MPRFRIPVIASEGWKYILFFGILGSLFLFFDPWFSNIVGLLCVLFAGFCFYFFRDPERTVPKTDDIICPADGTVLEVVTVEGEGYGVGRVIRIFMSVFDVHLQRAPVCGTVKSVRYLPGVFLDTRDPRAPFANENNSIMIQSPRGPVMVKQIAGLLARRIVCWVRENDELTTGDRIGLICIGSQVDLYVPSNVDILVKEGQKVVGGETVIGRWM